MTCKTVMVHLELGRSNADLLAVAGDLAERLRASVIGIAACRPERVGYGDVYVSGEVIEEERLEITREATAAESEFRSLLGARCAALEWRAAIVDGSPVDYFVGEARSADLFVTGPSPAGSVFGNPRHIDLGDLVMRMGRPVMVVPPGVRALSLDRATLAWKDGREARRAAIDALPLLGLAAHVSVVEVAAEKDRAAAQQRTADVAGWLGRHGIEAESCVLPGHGNDKADLAAAFQRQGTDLVVAGAYGHGRLREWTLGGVTMDLLLEPARCTLLSR